MTSAAVAPVGGDAGAAVAAPRRTAYAVDVTDTFDAKMPALRCHARQGGHRIDGIEEMVRGWLAERAAYMGLPQGRLAEMFHVIELT